MLEMKPATLEIPTPPVSRTSLQLLPEVHGDFLQEVFVEIQIAGQGADDPVERSANAGPLDDSVSGGSLLPGHDTIAAPLMQSLQERRWYKKGIGAGSGGESQGSYSQSDSSLGGGRRRNLATACCRL